LYEHLESKDYLRRDEKTGQWIAQPLVCGFEGDIGQWFSDLVATIFPPKFRGFEGKISLIVDECRDLQSPHTINPALNRLVRQAPIPRVLIAQNTHQLQDWNSASKSVMDELYLFRQQGPRNRALVTEMCGEEVWDIVEKLPQHHCVRYWFKRNGDEKQWEIWDKPEKWYVPIRKGDDK